MLRAFLLQDNLVLLHLEQLKEELVFSTIWVMFWNISRICFFYINIQNLMSNCSIIFLKFFQSCFFDGKFILSQLNLLIKVLIFVILSECFSICSWFNVTVTVYWKHLSYLLIKFFVPFLYFIQSGESVYDPP